ncbi:MAG: type II secretion system protein GspC [Sandaracinaceae bacterium]
MAQSPRQRRLLTLIVLSTLSITAVLSAQGVSQLAAAALLPLDASALTPSAPRDVQPTPRRRVDAEPMLRRNIFDHGLGDLLAEPEPEQRPDEPEVVVEEWTCGTRPPPEACTGSMRLVGTFVRVRRPDDSFATITDSTGTAYLYLSGMEVDQREVVCIERNLVVLKPEDSTHCSLQMFTSQPPVATARTSEPRIERTRRPRVSTGGLSDEELDAGIQQISEREFSVQRSLVDRLLADQAALMRTARVIPHEEDGQVVGVKLYGIRRSSLLGRLGVQNGDLLSTINGYDMASPDSALEAYARLRDAERITLNVVRRGSPLTIDYSIR